MKEESTVSEDVRKASRRGLLAGGLGVGIATAAGIVVAAVTSAKADGTRGRTGGGGADMAHGGAIHTQKHGGVTHTHDTVSHTHGVMVHALDQRTLKAVDTAQQPGAPA